MLTATSRILVDDYLLLPRGDLARLLFGGEATPACAAYVKELFPLQQEEAARPRKPRRPGKQSTSVFIRAAYACCYPQGHRLTPKKEVRTTLRAYIKLHFKCWTDLDDKTFQRHGF